MHFCLTFHVFHLTNKKIWKLSAFVDWQFQLPVRSGNLTFQIGILVPGDLLQKSAGTVLGTQAYSFSVSPSYYETVPLVPDRIAASIQRILTESDERAMVAATKRKPRVSL